MLFVVSDEIHTMFLDLNCQYFYGYHHTWFACDYSSLSRRNMERDKELTHIHETDRVFVLQEGSWRGRKPCQASVKKLTSACRYLGYSLHHDHVSSPPPPPPAHPRKARIAYQILADAESINRKKSFDILSLGWQDKMDRNKQQLEQDNLMYWVLKLLQMLNSAWDARKEKSISPLNSRVGWNQKKDTSLYIQKPVHPHAYPQTVASTHTENGYNIHICHTRVDNTVLTHTYTVELIHWPPEQW